MRPLAVAPPSGAPQSPRPQQSASRNAAPLPPTGGAHAASAASRARPISLERALERASRQTFKVIGAEQGVRIAQARLRGSRAAFLPQFSLSAQAQKYANLTGRPGTTVVGSSVVITQGNLYSNYVSLMGALNLYDGGQDQAAVDAAHDQLREGQSALVSARDRATIEALIAYSELLQAQDGARAQAELARLAGQELQFVRDRYARGSASLLDVNKSAAAEARARSAATQAAEAVRDRSADLAERIALDLPHGETLDAVSPLPPAPAETGGENDAVDRMPDVLAAQAKVARAEAEVRKAKGRYLPQVNLTAGYNWLGSTGNSALSDVLGHAAANNYTIGLSITQPLFPLASQREDVDKAVAELTTAQAALQQARIHARASLARARAELTRGREAVDAARTESRLAQRNLALAQALYDKGRLDGAALARIRAASIEADSAARSRQWQFDAARWAYDALLHPGDLVGRIRAAAAPPPATAANDPDPP